MVTEAHTHVPTVLIVSTHCYLGIRPAQTHGIKNLRIFFELSHFEKWCFWAQMSIFREIVIFNVITISTRGVFGARTQLKRVVLSALKLFKPTDTFWVNFVHLEYFAEISNFLILAIAATTKHDLQNNMLLSYFECYLYVIKNRLGETFRKRCLKDTNLLRSIRKGLLSKNIAFFSAWFKRLFLLYFL